MEQCSIVLHPVLCIFFSVHNAKRMLLPNRLRRFFFRAKMMTLLLLFFFFFKKRSVKRQDCDQKLQILSITLDLPTQVSVEIC